MISSGYKAIKRAVENHVNLTLVICFVLGLFSPDISFVPKESVVFFLAVAIFFSCSKITMEDLQQINLKEAFIFYGLRFLLLPVLIFLGLHAFLPEFSYGSFLLLLMPAGVTTTALCVITGGNPALALGVTVVSSLLAPFVVPALFGVFGQDITIDLWAVFQTLAIMVFVPIIVYFGFVRRIEKAKTYVRDNSTFMAILGIGIMVFIIIAQQKAVFLDDIWVLLKAQIVLWPLFLSIYGFGWIVFWRAPRKMKVTYALTSGAFNNALAISVAYVGFPDNVLVFVILSEIPWILSVPLFQFLVKKYDPDKIKSEQVIS